MNTNAKRRSDLIMIIAAMNLLVLAPRGSSALADSPPMTKGPEVSTVGTGPYLGPLPEELAKLAQQVASAETAPVPAKEPATATIATGSGNTLTVEELAKLVALQAILGTLPVPFMPKLELMEVSKDGIPSLTAQERDKRARERTTPNATPATLPTPQVRPAGSPGDTGSTPEGIAKIKGNATPAAPPSAPRSGR